MYISFLTGLASEGMDFEGLIRALSSVGFDGAIAVENEDRAFPGLKGCDMARRHLMGLLP